MDSPIVSCLTSPNAVLLYRFLAILLGVLSTLVFAAPTLPRLKGYVRPNKFEAGWGQLLTHWELNQDDSGFREVSEFLGKHEKIHDDVASDCLGFVTI